MEREKLVEILNGLLNKKISKGTANKFKNLITCFAPDFNKTKTLSSVG